MHRYSATDRLKLIFFIAALAAVVVTVLSGGNSSAKNVTKNKTSATAAIDDEKGRPANPQATPTPAAAAPAPPQTAAAAPKIEGCISCHGNTEPMHETRDGKLNEGKDGQGLSCTYCHGGNPFATTEKAAHVPPRYPDVWKRDGKASSANPERSNAALNRESREFVRFINPGDFRVTDLTCSSSACHAAEVEANNNSMMRHGAMLWGAALYNNGGFPVKDTHFGESYSEDGAPERLVQIPQPTSSLQRLRGILMFLDPLPRWEISQPGNVLRVFERGGKRRLEVGLPDRDEDAGRPDKGLSPRGLGTAQRTDPVYLGIQKTRLFDPTLNHLGTNDYPGDFRSSGCTACHVVYANDRSIVHSGPEFAKFGNMGTTATGDKSFDSRRNESGHPIKHQLTNQIPTSQCMVCHMHPGTNMVTTYMGMLWWDNETDGDKMYPAKQHNPSQDEEQVKLQRNPEGSSLRGNWSDRDFLQKTGTPEFNNTLKRTNFADFHGHGWLYRAVFKKDRKGRFTDVNGAEVKDVTPEKMAQAVNFRDTDNDANTTTPAGQPVHLKDIHLEKGMHCVDCHFRQDSHGNGILYSEPRAAIEIGCVDCHGSIQKAATLITSGPAAGQSIKETDGKLAFDKGRGRVLAAPASDRTRRLANNLYARDANNAKVAVFQRITADGTRKLFDKDVPVTKGDIIQNSLVEPGRWWRVPQTADTVTPGKSDYNWKSHYAKTVRMEQDSMETWGDVPKEEDESKLAHPDSQMTCFSCHSAWMTSCFGCHLSMTANRKMPNRHNEGDDTRNFTTYNYQVLRDDVFMLGRDGTVTGHKVAPVASRSAVVVSSQNQNREWIYSQQQTISTEGFSGQSFSTHVPHTVRSKETMGCVDCHVSEKKDNNAWMAQVLLQGTNFVNFMGRYVYVAAEEAMEVIPVTEHTEPQAVFGSTLHKVAYPDNYAKFEKGGRKLKTFFEHIGNPKVLQIQVRGEYAYVAAGEGGLRVYDVAQIDHKGFSERITTAPVSPFGQKFYVDTKYATAVASPTTLGVDPARARLTSDGKFVTPDVAEKMRKEWESLPESERANRPHPLRNEEQPIHSLYAYLYVADKYEGLILVNAATLLDGDPLNNYLKRAVTFNPEGALDGANNITIAGTYAYVTTEKGLVIVNINDPLNPRVVGKFGEPQLKHPHAINIQFRYGFIVDEEGLKVLDVTLPEQARIVEGAEVPLAHAHDVYVARTYAYVANGKEGIAIINVEQPEKPTLYMKYDAGGELNDTHQVKVAMTNASLFAYVADGHNGLRVLQLTSPETMAEFAGFSPAPQPKLIASFHTHGPAIGISKGLDRDRAADESGNQLAVFGRRGARPFTLEEMQKLYISNGKLRTVLDTETMTEPPPKRRDPTGGASTATKPSKPLSDAPKAISHYLPDLTSTPTRRRTAAIGGGAAGAAGLFIVLAGRRRRRRLLQRRDS